MLFRLLEKSIWNEGPLRPDGSRSTESAYIGPINNTIKSAGQFPFAVAS
jgi:hypothetical protein